MRGGRAGTGLCATRRSAVWPSCCGKSALARERRSLLVCRLDQQLRGGPDQVEAPVADFAAEVERMAALPGSVMAGYDIYMIALRIDLARADDLAVSAAR